MKTYTCPCGSMKVTFPRKSTATVEGGFFTNNQHAIYKCRTKGCTGAIRLGYTVEHTHKGEVFHRPGVDGPGGRGNGTTNRRKVSRKNPKKPQDKISFQFLD